MSLFINTSYLSGVLWQNFFKLCMGIDLSNGEFGFANGFLPLDNNRVMALDVKISFPLSICRTNEWTSIKCCICIDINKIQVGTVTHIFFFNFQQNMTLDWCQKFVYAQYFCELMVWLNFIYALVLTKGIKTIIAFFFIDFNIVIALDSCSNHGCSIFIWYTVDCSV